MMEDVEILSKWLFGGNTDILYAIQAADEEEELEASQSRHAKRPRCHTMSRNRGYALHTMEVIERESPGLFRRMYRLDVTSFNKLLDIIGPHIERNGNAAIPGINSQMVIPAKTRLAVTLRWLAGGSYHDICFAYGIAVGSFYADHGVLWGTIAAINQHLLIDFPSHDPDTLESISQGFANKYTHGKMHGCVMAVDGWVCRTRKPFARETPNIMTYRNRKDTWGVVCFAGCDHELRFRMFSAQCCGSTNDSIAWDLTSVARTVFKQNLLMEPYYAVCDEALACTENLLVPYGGRQLGIWKDSFNYHLSAMRQCIERAFGLLVGRWGILWRPLLVAIDRWPSVIHACAKLHNFCIDNNITAVETYHEDYQNGDCTMGFLTRYNTDEVNGDRRTLGNNAHDASFKRTAITNYLQSQDCIRPVRTAVNSRS